jgi:putative FmdB family regulatory protein
MPVYEFSCGSCGERFEELVGPHVGKREQDVRCPACDGVQVERLPTSSYAPIHRRMTANQKRRSEAARDTSGGGARQRFKQQRAAEKRASRRGR